MPSIFLSHNILKISLYTPVFRRFMVWWCLSIHLSVRPSVTVFRTFLLHASAYWAEMLYVTFFLWTFEYRQFLSFFFSYAPLELKILEIHSYLHFSLTRFEKLSWNFAFDFVYCTADQALVLSICVNFGESYAHLELFLMEIHTFLLQALTYWAEILHMTLFYCTTDQVIVSSIA